jgi:hypothetical protein
LKNDRRGVVELQLSLALRDQKVIFMYGRCLGSHLLALSLSCHQSFPSPLFQPTGSDCPTLSANINRKRPAIQKKPVKQLDNADRWQ